MKWLFERLSEGSTWAGLAAIVTPTVGAMAGQVSWQAVAAAAIPAAIAIATKDAGRK